MANLSKLLATLVIWTVIALIAVVALSNTMFIQDAWVMIPLIGVPVTFGFLLTLAMWAPAALPWVDANRLHAISGDYQRDQSASEKRKRDESAAGGDARIDMLMQMMTPDEREDFKQSLKERILNDLTVGDDGELKSGGVSLTNLLDDASDSRQGRR